MSRLFQIAEVLYLRIVDTKGKTFSVLRKLIEFTIWFSYRLHISLVFKFKERNKPFEEGVIISLTSYSSRFRKLDIVLDSLLNQSVRVPIYLYISKDDELEFKRLRLHNRFKDRLNICYVEEDLRSHKKYYYAFKEFTEKLIITFDDDIVYDSQIVARLLDCHESYQNNIICSVARRIIRDGKDYKNYMTWPILRGLASELSLCPIGVGGVLYPPHKWRNEGVVDKAAIRAVAPYTDDLWLRMHSFKANINVTRVSSETCLLSVFDVNKHTLTKRNVVQGGNDKELQQILKHLRI